MPSSASLLVQISCRFEEHPSPRNDPRSYLSGRNERLWIAWSWISQTNVVHQRIPGSRRPCQYYDFWFAVLYIQFSGLGVDIRLQYIIPSLTRLSIICDIGGNVWNVREWSRGRWIESLSLRIVRDGRSWTASASIRAVVGIHMSPSVADIMSRFDTLHLHWIAYNVRSR